MRGWERVADQQRTRRPSRIVRCRFRKSSHRHDGAAAVIDPTALDSIVRLAEPPTELRYAGPWRHAKRALDLAVAIVLVPILLLPMLVIAIALKRSSPGPVLFRQNRIGQHGQTISVLKFRTMHVDAEARLHADEDLYRRYVDNDYKLPLEDDPRIHRIGRFLRRTSLDELPQVFNVLAGTMSLVGPRPVVTGELECYGPHTWAYLAAKPGITGRWQSDGRNHVRYPERAELDAEYVQDWTFSRDLWIILKTVPAVLRAHGSH